MLTISKQWRSAEMTPEQMAGRLREVREQAGQTQRQFAASIAVSHGTVAKWERALLPPSTLQLRKIAQLYKVNPRHFGLDPTGHAVITDPKEQQLLRIFRALPAAVQDNVLDIASIAKDALAHRGEQSHPADSETLTAL